MRRSGMDSRAQCVINLRVRRSIVQIRSCELGRPLGYECMFISCDVGAESRDRTNDVCCTWTCECGGAHMSAATLQQDVEKGVRAVFRRAPSLARALRAAKLPRFVPDESVNVACPHLTKDMGVVFAALPHINQNRKHMRMCMPHLRGSET